MRPSSRGRHGNEASPFPRNRLRPSWVARGGPRTLRKADAPAALGAPRLCFWTPAARKETSAGTATTPSRTAARRVASANVKHSHLQSYARAAYRNSWCVERCWRTRLSTTPAPPDVHPAPGRTERTERAHRAACRRALGHVDRGAPQAQRHPARTPPADLRCAARRHQQERRPKRHPRAPPGTATESDLRREEGGRQPHRARPPARR